MDEASWNRMAQFYYNGKVVSEQPVGQFLWFILFDAIHHRGPSRGRRVKTCQQVGERCARLPVGRRVPHRRGIQLEQANQDFANDSSADRAETVAVFADGRLA